MDLSALGCDDDRSFGRTGTALSSVDLMKDGRNGLPVVSISLQAIVMAVCGLPQCEKYPTR